MRKVLTFMLTFFFAHSSFATDDEYQGIEYSGPFSRKLTRKATGASSSAEDDLEEEKSRVKRTKDMLSPQSSFSFAKGLEEAFEKGRYDALISDITGVIHNGSSCYPKVVDTLVALEKKGIPVVYLSNTPRPNVTTLEKLCELGASTTPDHVITSGDMVREQLSTPTDEIFLGDKKIWHFGAERNQDILASLEFADSITFVSTPEEANLVLLTQLAEEGESDDIWQPTLQKCLDLNLPMVCANPDKVAVHKGSTRRPAGHFASLYKKMGGEVTYYGKPDALIFRKTLKRLQSLYKHKLRGLSKKRFLMIGDTLETDILGSYNATKKGSNIDSALVLTGNASTALANKDLKAKDVFGKKRHPFFKEQFSDESVTPTWVLKEFGW